MTKTGLLVIGRIVVALTLPFMLPASFVITLWREMRQAFRYAWNDACREIDAARKIWRDGP